MFKSKLFISLMSFIFFMILTSIVKNQTILLEKKIVKANNEINIIKFDLYETQLDYYYLSSPEVLINRINEFSSENYVAMDHSKIYLNIQDFLNEKYKSTKKFNEKKK